MIVAQYRSGPRCLESSSPHPFAEFGHVTYCMSHSFGTAGSLLDTQVAVSHHQSFRFGGKRGHTYIRRWVWVKTPGTVPQYQAGEPMVKHW